MIKPPKASFQIVFKVQPRLNAAFNTWNSDKKCQLRAVLFDCSAIKTETALFEHHATVSYGSNVRPTKVKLPAFTFNLNSAL